ncbi:hypothetical protein VOLCADRAFT_94618 [Volvox carteri f. nagariensis]|uniref:Uncharacterized protein n=1 Tax=Volvox carteri f. nagariensis TaxID=3068 RepID=D8U5A0_VOLCA|nr:uncharacterized protein VOLCADRAFT_94618 [Volvox carteri f. nagariensis]EFJ45113.1 hypothetical protein VOLCADRAFT_94618 [Volvox carteri f. nagariensis]|eukprot:XP_002953789.1 hypothetical protein VOLCADRAFT_94618 [Volvox carteri f. nagariensis]
MCQESSLPPREANPSTHRHPMSIYFDSASNISTSCSGPVMTRMSRVTIYWTAGLLWRYAPKLLLCDRTLTHLVSEPERNHATLETHIVSALQYGIFGVLFTLSKEKSENRIRIRWVLLKILLDGWQLFTTVIMPERQAWTINPDGTLLCTGLGQSLGCSTSLGSETWDDMDQQRALCISCIFGSGQLEPSGSLQRVEPLAAALYKASICVSKLPKRAPEEEENPGYGAYLAVLYSMLALLSINIAMCVWVAWCFKEHKFPVVWPIKVLRVFSSVFFQAFDVASLNLLQLGITCRFTGTSRDEPKLHFDLFPQYSCTKPPHIMHAVVSALCLILFVAIALLLNMAEVEVNPLSRRPMALGHSGAEVMAFGIKTLILSSKPWYRPRGMPTITMLDAVVKMLASRV